MKTRQQRALAFSTLTVLEQKLSEIDDLEAYKQAEREEIERVLRVLIEDEPVVTLLDGVLKKLRDELPKKDFGDRVPDLSAARDALRILKRALGMPAMSESKTNDGEQYGES